MQRRHLLASFVLPAAGSITGCTVIEAPLQEQSIRSAAFILLTSEQGRVSRPGLGRFKLVTFALGDAFLSSLQQLGESTIRASRPTWRTPQGSIISSELRKQKLVPNPDPTQLSIERDEAQSLATKLDVDLVVVFHTYFMNERPVPSGFGMRLDRGDVGVRTGGLLIYSGMALSQYNRAGLLVARRISVNNSARSSMERFGISTELDEVSNPSVLDAMRQGILSVARRDLLAVMQAHGYGVAGQ